MLRENHTTADAIIDLIRTLPAEEQRRIAGTVSSTPKKTSAKKDKDRSQAIKAMNEFVRKQKTSLPKGFKFDRDEVHERK